jgi:hypothetical protein
VVGDGAFVDDFPVLVEHADRVLLVAEIETYLSAIASATADGDEWDFGFHGSGIVARPSSADRHCLLI